MVDEQVYSVRRILLYESRITNVEFVSLQKICVPNRGGVIENKNNVEMLFVFSWKSKHSLGQITEELGNVNHDGASPYSRWGWLNICFLLTHHRNSAKSEWYILVYFEFFLMLQILDSAKHATSYFNVLSFTWELDGH